LMNFRRIQSAYFGLPIVVSGKDEAPAVVYPNGEIRVAEYEPASSWTYLTL
jgi:hypothetical protein